MRSLSSILKAKVIDKLYEYSGDPEFVDDPSFERAAAEIDRSSTEINQGSSEIDSEIDRSITKIDRAEVENAVALRQAIKKAHEIHVEATARYKEIIEDAQKEGRQIKEAAELKGYEEGYQKGLEEGQRIAEEKARAGLSELQETIENIKEEGRTALKFQEKHLIQLAFELARKILRQQVEIDKEVIYRMLESTILENNRGVTIYLSEYHAALDIHIDKFLCNRIENISSDNKLVLIKEENDVIMVETDRGIIDLNVNGQLENLKDAIHHAQ